MPKSGKQNQHTDADRTAAAKKIFVRVFGKALAQYDTADPLLIEICEYLAERVPEDL